MPADFAAKQPSVYRWPVPPADNDCQVADMLCLTSWRALDWLVKPHVRRTTAVNHYRIEKSLKRDGTDRVIEQPRPLMKRVQRCIAAHVLSEIPIHDAAHAFRRSRSIYTCASPHVGQPVLIKFDLRDYFASIPCKRVASTFRYAGYSHDVALTLARLCTAPSAIADRHRPDSILLKSRLPQGAPTSPALANIVAFGLDRRLTGLALSLAATYTRYADDLIFSGPQELARGFKRLTTTVAAIVAEEGFELNFRKTKLMTASDRQNVLGLTVNERLNNGRREFEDLKALLNNCRRCDPESQNHNGLPAFREHVRGKIEPFRQSNAHRYRKLMQMYHAIDWPSNRDR